MSQPSNSSLWTSTVVPNHETKDLDLFFVRK